MPRIFSSFSVNSIGDFKKRLLHWADQFNECCFLDNHGYSFSPHSYECVLAAGAVRKISALSGDAFDQFKKFCSVEKDWVFGHLGYDLKNELELLESSHPDNIAFPDLLFFVPEVVVLLNNNEVSIGCLNNTKSQSVYKQIIDTVIPDFTTWQPVDVKSRFSKQDYILTIQKLRTHILKGDCYEINFCQEFYAENILLNPLQVYFSLSEISPNPFAAFYKIGKHYLCCASPERYLKKTGNVVIAQPIKGTSRRNLQNQKADDLNKIELSGSNKERAENVMIVDLVRNDLSKVCQEGTVKVEELFGIYSYPQVHQMISTISGIVKDKLDFTDVLKATFPMGSMTGAPKKRVMELIEQYEQTKRGLYSGALGYITPDGDFDFNVVIRSILYNAEQRYLSYQVGSAITFNSDPEKEYEECLLKAAAIKSILS